MTIDLNFIWFILVGVLFTGYAILDGFDLGVGALHPFAKSDEEKRAILNAIGPVWDGNEVWLITGGGALFAAFPKVYATVFSGFYIPFMLFLLGVIFRAVSIEFRSKQAMKWWRSLWDTCFTVSSVIIALLAGVALANMARGIPIDSDGEYAGGFFNLLNPYSLMVGVTTLSLFVMHGSLYLAMKTEGSLHDRIRRLAIRAMIVFSIFYLVSTLWTVLAVPHMVRWFLVHPFLFVFPLLNALAIFNIFIQFRKGRDGRAFTSSCAALLLLMLIFGIGMFPNMVWSLPTPDNSLTIYNAASSQKTLSIMLKIAAIGMPLVLAYTVSIYWIFKGKVKIDPMSY